MEERKVKRETEQRPSSCLNCGSGSLKSLSFQVVWCRQCGSWMSSSYYGIPKDGDKYQPAEAIA